MVAESNDLLASCFSIANLMVAARQCVKGVDWKGKVQRFDADMLCQCARLRREVLSETWRPRPVHSFTIMERGKLRHVMPVDMWDRVVERCLCNQVLVPYVTSHVIEGCGACLPGRGLDRSIERVREMVEAAPMEAWVVITDFHDYFHSIRRAMLLGLLRRDVPECFIRITAEAIGGYDGIGIELGSHVCQVLAVWFPTPLDHLMLSAPENLGYERYMDDSISVFRSRDAALNGLMLYEQSAAAMGLSMNPNKTFAQPITTPFVFCKRRITKRSSGTRVNVRKPQTRSTVRHIKNALGVDGIDPMPLRASSLGSVNRGDADLSRLILENIDWPEGMPPVL